MNQDLRLSTRMKREDFQGTFTRQILKAAASDDIISFAGGLPNPVSFPVEQIREAACYVLETQGERALQYGPAAGYEPLRAYIAKRYEKQGINDLTADDILITNGSQQALDILGAVFLDEGDPILVENPSYLAALQAFHYYGPAIHTVDLLPDGIDCAMLEQLLKKERPKFFYGVPNFQNPTGITYTETVRQKMAALLAQSGTFFIEDNPYGELRFEGKAPRSVKAFLGDYCILSGTFSKTVSPGMRIGWLACTNETLRRKMLDYKQASDIHTNLFCQMILHRYLTQNSLDEHIKRITGLYRHQADHMLHCIQQYFPPQVSCPRPEGGMFLWAELPEGLHAVELAALAARKGVAIAAGDPFYEKERKVATFRLNYTNCNDEDIQKGISALGELIYGLLP